MPFLMQPSSYIQADRVFGLWGENSTPERNPHTRGSRKPHKAKNQKDQKTHVGIKPRTLLRYPLGQKDSLQKIEAVKAMTFIARISILCLGLFHIIFMCLQDYTTKEV